jgi:threonine synthase
MSDVSENFNFLIIIVVDFMPLIEYNSHNGFYKFYNYKIRENFDGALNLVKGLSSKYPLILVNSVNFFRIEGQRTSDYEIKYAKG